MSDVPEKWRRLGEAELHLTYYHIEVAGQFFAGTVEADYGVLTEAVLRPVLTEITRLVLDVDHAPACPGGIGCWCPLHRVDAILRGTDG